jgi:hypothetical protein
MARTCSRTTLQRYSFFINVPICISLIKLVSIVMKGS